MTAARNRDQDLLRRVLAGERAAREDFARSFAGIIHQAVRHTLRLRGVPFSAQDVEDLLHTVFLHLLENDTRRLRQYRGENGCSVASWIRIVTVRCVLNALRRRRVDALTSRNHLPLDALAATASEDDPAARLEDAERRSILAKGLNALPPREALLLRLYFDRGLEAQEIAEILQTPVSNVHTLKHRALQRLKGNVTATCWRVPGKPESLLSAAETGPAGQSSAEDT